MQHRVVTITKFRKTTLVEADDNTKRIILQSQDPHHQERRVSGLVLLPLPPHLATTARNKTPRLTGNLVSGLVAWRRDMAESSCTQTRDGVSSLTLKRVVKDPGGSSQQQVKISPPLLTAGT
jgi:hypothetical protein